MINSVMKNARLLAAIAVFVAQAGILAAAPSEGMTFYLVEEMGLPRRNEPVVIPGKEILRQAGKAAVKVRNIRLYGPEGEIPVQVDERDGGYTWAQKPNGILDANDEVVFLATCSSNAVSEYRLTLSAGGKKRKKRKKRRTILSVKRVPTAMVKQKGYDFLLKNSRLSAGLRAADPGDPERMKLDTNKYFRGLDRGEGSIVFLEVDGLRFQHVQIPFTGFQGRRNELWDGARVVGAGPVRILVETRKKLRGKFRHPMGSWSVSWNDRADVDGDLFRTFTIYADSPIIDLEDRFVAEKVGEDFTMNYRFHSRPPAAKGSDWELTRTVIIPTGKGLKLLKYDRRLNCGGKLSTEEMEEGWLAVRDESSGVGLTIAYDPDSVAKIQWGHPPSWSGEYLYSRPQITHLLIETYNASVVETMKGGMRFRVWVMGPKTRVDPGAIRRIQYEYALADTLSWTRPDAVAGESKVRAELVKTEAELTRLQEAEKKYRYSGLLAGISRKPLKKFAAELKAIKKIKIVNPVTRRLVDDLAQRLNGEMKALWRTFDWDRIRILLADKDSFSRRFTGFAEDSLLKIRPQGPFPQELRTKVHLELARGEAESFQTILLTTGKPVKDIKIDVSDLNGPGGAVIKAGENIQRFRIFNVYRSIKNGVTPVGKLWPDPLIPLAGCPGYPALDKMLFQPQIDKLDDLSADRANGFWFTVRTPRDARAGLYRGQVSFTANGKSLRFPVEVRVHDFSLPEEPGVIGDVWFRNGPPWYYYSKDFSLEEYKRGVDWIHQYRLNAQLSWVFLSQLVTVTIEKDGRYAFDFAKIDPWIEAALKHSRWFNVNLGCGAAWTAHFGGVFGRRTPILDKRTGKTIKFPEKPISKMDMIKHPIFKQFWKAYIDHIRQKGWLDRCYLENIDEPPYGKGAINKPRNKFLRAFHGVIREIAPDMRLMNYGMSPDPDMHGWGEKYVDIWGPSVSGLEEWKDALAAQMKKGKPFITYECGAGKKTLKHRTPGLMVYNAAIDIRIIPWMAYKYGSIGVLYYMGNFWGTNTEFVEKVPEKRWPVKDWNTGSSNWASVYPAPKAKYLFPSLRLENVRDGMEDFEYLRLLKKAAEKAPKNPDTEAARRLLNLDPLVKSVLVWDHDPAKLRAHRQKIAEAIVKLNRR